MERAVVGGGEEIHDLSSLLSGEGRDFVVRNGGEKVRVADFAGKTVAIYFSAHWCPPCRQFTPVLAEAYVELASKGFEVVFVSSDRDDDTFAEYFSEMPWLAVPFSDSSSRRRIKDLFNVRGIPHLVVLDGSTGKVLTTDAVSVVREYGTTAFPFTPERLAQLKEEEEEARRNQTLKSLLTFGARDFVVKNNGDKVPISEIEGKLVGLLFSVRSYPPAVEFESILAEMYNELKNKGEPLEIVSLFLDDEEPSGEVPWLAVPAKDKVTEKLARYFELSTLPILVLIAPDGKTLNANAAELVEEHGAEAYPFSPEKLAELAELERQRDESQTLESVLVSGNLDFVIGQDGTKVPVSELVGKNVLIYFSAHWCPPCRGFTPKLVQVYNEIKAKDSAFEVVFVSSDRDQSSFNEYFSSMPWLALPFGDPRKKFLDRRFKIDGIPSLIAIGPSGRTVTTEARDMIEMRGAAAYPFTGTSFLGSDDDEEEEEEEEEEGEGGAAPAGYVCEGDVCRKV
ncbi:DC1 domain-containing protein [Wolffia australiana]